MPPANRFATGDVTLHHVAMYVADLEATRRFYVDALGMREIDRPADLTLPGAYFRLGTAEIQVAVDAGDGHGAGLGPRQAGNEPYRGCSVRVAFGVSDLEPILSQLAEHGTTFVGGPRIRADDVEQWWVADPDGRILELVCQLDEATAGRRRRELRLSSAVPVTPGREPAGGPAPTPAWAVNRTRSTEGSP